jgi:hypothetical protein
MSAHRKLHERNIGRPMKEIVANPNMVAYCGLYCGACKSFLKDKCPGCHDNSKATWCKVRSCCIENIYLSCADCKTFENPRNCKYFNNPISKAISFFLRSDRSACICQIKSLGIEGHASDMASNMRHTIRRS